MKILIAPDSFKESLSAVDVAQNIALGVSRGFPAAEIKCIPVADGGEGTVDALILATNGRKVKVRVHNPLMQVVDSFYGVLGDEKTAVIEMAAASGLELLSPQDINPMLTTTYGTGELMLHALESGYRNLIVGIGGSATNDGGVGMAKALGIKFFDKSGNEIGCGGGALNNLHKIDVSQLTPLISEAKITVACDVDNLLCGEKGASAIYAPQKGATPEMVNILDSNLAHLSSLIHKQLGIEVANLKGGGAAGGLGAGLVAFTQAILQSGFSIIKSITNLEEWISQSDLVITAEGKIDCQTVYGKTPFGVAQIAKRYKIPVIALAGIVTPDADVLYEYGITSLFAIADKPMTVSESCLNAGVLLQRVSERIMRVIGAIKRE